MPSSRKPGPHRQRTPGITDVARMAGVSTATVSRALVTPERVRPETRDAVMAAVAATGYTPNQAARSLRARRTRLAMVIVPTIANLVFPHVIRGIDAALFEAGYGLIIGNTDNQRSREGHFVDLAFARQVDGLLLMNGWMPMRDGRALTDSGLPIVALSAAIPGPDIPKVVVQDREASAEAAAHLIGLGHVRLGYISGPAGNWVDAQRWQGFREGVAAAGLDPAEITFWQGEFDLASGTAAADAFLALDRRPTGVYAASDAMAVAFIKRLRQAGVSVPGDVSVIGFDGIELAFCSEPTLTTFHQPLNEMGRTGARILLQMMSDPGRSQPEWTRLPVTLAPGGSTGPAPAPARRTRKPARVAG